MLSVLIPVYNYKVSNLVHALHKQLSAASLDFEIICLDDASKIDYIEQNKTIEALPKTSYKQSQKNNGIAVTRDQLVAQSNYPWILLLDADVAIESQSYISNYLNAIKQGHEVIFGGICYQSKRPENQEILRWKYGRSYEEKDAKLRNLKPYKNTSAGNLCVKKRLYQLFASKEVGNKYGMDIFLGPQLKHKGIRVYHINNCVIHLGLESSKDFLKKTERAVETLLSLYRKDQIVLHDNTLLTVFLGLKKLRIHHLVALLFNLSKTLLTSNLLSNRPMIRFLQFYKIGYLCLLDSKQLKLKL